IFNSSSTFYSGFFVNKLTITVTTKVTINPGKISYKFQKSDPGSNISEITTIHKITVIDAATIPIKEPILYNSFQYNERITIGPNAAQNPAHALPTKSKIVEFGFHAITIATAATSSTEKRPTITNSFLFVSALSLPRISL